MEYRIEMERVQRVVVWFEAENDGAAEREAERINNETTSKEYESGDERYSYNLQNVDEETTLVDWD